MSHHKKKRERQIAFKVKFLQATPRIILAVINRFVIIQPLEMKISKGNQSKCLLEKKNTNDTVYKEANRYPKIHAQKQKIECPLFWA